MLVMSTADQTDFLTRLQYLYTNSASVRAALDDFAANGDYVGGTELRISGGLTGTGEAGTYNIPLAGGGETLVYGFEMSKLTNSAYIGTDGTLHENDPTLTIAHELSHGLRINAQDPNVEATDIEKNAATYDFDGGAVAFQNAVALELGTIAAVRASYEAQTSKDDLPVLGLTVGQNYTDGHNIDTARFGLLTNDNIDMTAHGSTSNLIFGFAGFDVLTGGSGSD